MDKEIEKVILNLQFKEKEARPYLMCNRGWFYFNKHSIKIRDISEIKKLIDNAVESETVMLKAEIGRLKQALAEYETKTDFR